MTDEQRKTFVAAFERWFKGDTAAVKLCADLLECAHVWDDLIDRDNALLTEEQVDAAFRTLLIDIPLNVFWRRNADYLLPVLHSVWLQWKAANVLEREPDHIDKAYMLRASIYQIFQMCAVLIGGHAWATQVGPEIWRLYGETKNDFMKAKANA